MKYDKHIKRDNCQTIEECNLKKFNLDEIGDLKSWFIKSNQNNYKIKNIEKIIKKINEYKEKPVFILGDYDADGVTSMSIIYLALKFKNFSYVDCIAPRRDEGFGLNKDMVNKKGLKANNLGFKCKDCLIITVDNGIAQLDTIEYAKQLGFSVIVTDHHLPVVEEGNKKLPNADYIINPNAIENSSDFNGYCGAGLAYKLAFELLADDKRKYLLRSIAAIGTICDQMSLVEENYVIVNNALYDLNNKINTQLPVFKALSEIFNIAKWDSSTIGFTIGPAINALERVENGACLIGVKLLTCFNYDKCLQYAIRLKKYNEKRKYLTQVAMKKADEILEKEEISDKPIVICIPGIKEGLIGIIAGRICEKYKLPVGVFTDGKDDILKGSFRSIEGFNIIDLLNKSGELFETYGGHEGAAGASILANNFSAMKESLLKNSIEIEKESTDLYYYDLEIDNKDIIHAIEENERFEPFGMGHEEVKFKINNFFLEPDYGDLIKEMKGNSVRLKSTYSKAIGFSLLDLAKDNIKNPGNLTVYGSIQYNYWKKDDGDIIINPQIIMDDFEICTK